MDEHGKRLERGRLADLFPRGEEMAKAPWGQGHGIYLGKLLRGCREAKPGPWLEEFLRVLKEANVEPRIKVQPTEGPPTYEVEPRLFEDGPLRYLFLFRGGPQSVSTEPWSEEAKEEKEGAQSGKFVLRWSKRAEIYDVREGKYLGGGEEVSLGVAPHQVKLLALMPYQVEGMQVTAGPARGRQVPVKAELRVAGGRAGRHVFRLTLLGPDGQEIACLARNVEAPGGVYENEIPLALNDPPGKYTLAFRDVATGTQGQAEVTVR
jgi:hypothetical protein